MTMIVIMPGGFHPFHAGHLALYQSAKKAFPDAEVYVAATNDQSERPFPFSLKEKLARLAGVEEGHFIQVKSPFQAKEITSHFDPNSDVLVFVRSEKDKTEQPQPGGTKKDGSPAYFQPYTGKNLQPFGKHAYISYLPTVKFGPGITSATEIRKAWPTLNDKQKLIMVMSLYPNTKENPKLAQNVVNMFDEVMGNNVMEDKDNDLFIAGDPESQELLRYAREHYPTARSMQQAFIKFVQRALKHSKEEDDEHDNQIAKLNKVTKHSAEVDDAQDHEIGDLQVGVGHADQDDRNQDQQIMKLQQKINNLSTIVGRLKVSESTDYLDEK